MCRQNLQAFHFGIYFTNIYFRLERISDLTAVSLSTMWTHISLLLTTKCTHTYMKYIRVHQADIIKYTWTTKTTSIRLLCHWTSHPLCASCAILYSMAYFSSILYTYLCTVNTVLWCSLYRQTCTMYEFHSVEYEFHSVELSSRVQVGLKNMFSFWPHRPSTKNFCMYVLNTYISYNYYYGTICDMCYNLNWFYIEIFKLIYVILGRVWVENKMGSLL